MNIKKNILSITAIYGIGLVLSSAMAAATFTLDIQDGAGEGFNDPTVVAPIGGNTGTTLGEQRQKVFERAGEIWGGFINSNVDIVIASEFNPLECNGNTAVLGSAGSTFIFRNFANRPFSNTWYHSALADSISGSDRNPGDADIVARFNSDIDDGCLNGNVGWYYGLDGMAPANTTSLLPVVLHELGHGLGSSTFTNGSTGAFNGGVPDSWSRFMTDLRASSSWFDMASNSDRMASATDTGFLVWDGPNVNAKYRQILNPSTDTANLKINSPSSIADLQPSGTADFGPPASIAGVSGNIVLAIDDESIMPGDINDGCSTVTNNLTGLIALINRGSCDFNAKVENAQNAGAIGVIITNNIPLEINGMTGVSPNITIPSLFVTQAAGDEIKSELGGLVHVTMGLFDSHRGSNSGHVRLFAPNPFQQGSSVSHWDTPATPSLLMEPSITPALFDQIDLTFQLFQDIGWDMVIVDPIFRDGFEAPNL